MIHAHPTNGSTSPVIPVSVELLSSATAAMKPAGLVVSFTHNYGTYSIELIP